MCYGLSMGISSENWFPPSYSSELVTKLKAKNQDSCFAPPWKKTHCYHRAVPGFSPELQCKRNPVWWHPDCVDAYCDFHVTTRMKKYMRAKWARSLYQMTIDEICLAYPHITLF